MHLSTGKHVLLLGLALLAARVQAGNELEQAVLADTDFVLDRISVVEKMVVTGTRTRQSQQHSPVRVDVVTQESIRKRHAGDAAEAVEMVSGISIRDIHGKDGSEAWIQGISANRVLVMVDGEPVSASTGSSVDLTQLAIGEIEQVEIVKGATSALYGSAAMGGAINLITARPGPGLHGTVSADAGSFGSQNPDGDATSLSQQRMQARASYGSDSFSLAGGVSARFSDGFQVEPQQWSQQGPDGHKINAFATATVMPSPTSEYTVRVEQYDQQQHNRITALLPPPNHRKHKQDDAQREQLSLRGSWVVQENRISAHGYDENYRNMSSPDGSFERHAEFSTQKAGVQWDNDTIEAHTWTMGAEFFAETLDQQKILADGAVSNEVDGCGDIGRDRMEIYVQDDVRLGKLSLVPGLRMQNDSDFGSQLTPKINLRHDFIRAGEQLLYLRAGVGSGYRVPNLKERCYVFDHSHLGYMIVGNENLQPEKSTSYQFGLAYQPLKALQIEANLFRNDLKDLIEIVYSHHEGDVSVSQYRNVDSAYTQGMEFDLAYSFYADWKLAAAYALLRAIDEKTGERLKDRPGHQIKLQLDYQNDRGTGISLLGSWQSDEHNAALADDSPAWHKIDLKLNQSLHDAWSVYGGINNITDTQRKFDGSYDNRPVEGRLVYAGFRFDY